MRVIRAHSVPLGYRTLANTAVRPEWLPFFFRLLFHFTQNSWVFFIS
jgi:hypothetical protein